MSVNHTTIFKKRFDINNFCNTNSKIHSFKPLEYQKYYKGKTKFPNYFYRRNCKGHTECTPSHTRERRFLSRPVK